MCFVVLTRTKNYINIEYKNLKVNIVNEWGISVNGTALSFYAYVIVYA
jgi:hypothetical protein